MFSINRILSNNIVALTICNNTVKSHNCEAKNNRIYSMYMIPFIWIPNAGDTLIHGDTCQDVSIPEGMWWLRNAQRGLSGWCYCMSWLESVKWRIHLELKMFVLLFYFCRYLNQRFTLKILNFACRAFRVKSLYKV